MFLDDKSDHKNSCCYFYKCIATMYIVTRLKNERIQKLKSMQTGDKLSFFDVIRLSLVLKLHLTKPAYENEAIEFVNIKK